FACKSKSRFLAAASHDLRQPVHSLTMLAEALRGEAKGQVVRELVDNVSASVDSLDELLTDLLDISRLDAAVVKVRKLPVNIRPVIESIVDDLRTSADAKNIYIRTHISDTFVYSDPVLLGTVIRKLLVNAVQFTQRGGVLVGLRKRGDTVLVQVWDSGPGIAHENSEDIFVEFYRIDGSGRESGKGLGLGLPISKRLSDLLGHELRFSSRPGKGSVFEIRLQCIQQQKIIPVHAARSARQVSLSGRRLLVVDNEVAILQGTLAVLKNWQCEVSTATNAKDALALVKSGAHFDGYLCDYDLGSEMNGIALLEQLQALDGGRTPGIIITGNTDLDFIRMAADAGHTVLHKPVKPAQLRALLMRQSQLTRLPETYA
ncbi:MAG: hybrid sensor histidine kinase/response regulator, partial [Gammaproteobacteria bacterium]|nr:hybrid sensor histidine kinase/response regulator [Gammaproteobacteria bacterium]